MSTRLQRRARDRSLTPARKPRQRDYLRSTRTAMRKSRFSAEQISTALRQVESGAPVAEVTRKLWGSEKSLLVEEAVRPLAHQRAA